MWSQWMTSWPLPKWSSASCRGAHWLVDDATIHALNNQVAKLLSIKAGCSCATLIR